MGSTSRIDIRLTEEEKTKAITQAEILGLVSPKTGKGDISAYLRLVINLDAATGIINRLKEEGK